MTSFKAKFFTLTALGAIGGAIISVPVHAQNTGFSDAQKDEIGSIVNQYLQDNPNVVIEAIESFRAQQEANAQREAEEKIASNLAQLTSKEHPFIGNPDGDITIVEFFDYNCGYCKRALPDVQKVVEDDKNVRVVFKEMPILGPTSRTASIWALAAHKQDKYFDYHVALMEFRGPKSDEQLEKIAKDVGLDVEQAKKDIDSGEIQKELDRLAAVARDIGVAGTPAFIVGNTFIPGYVGADALKAAVAEEREKAKKDG